ncbi:DNA gyrase subunit A [Endozoicomonas montiporae]|uniref:DNA gyrase subunit A n=2 Tax=Endozoicomonas montiporae TaxID=1027273 RepID=A0A081NAP7_9GAMM|nr:DNA gyrase subunit A [Endozoicomonas montiporae]AMO56788.1 DNA gyrase subunit A [Endozoicomonas montiporae CL-33]KEQ15520.1 DNA gyrase subunit A [Endozoicomonas montiporae]
MTDIAKEILPVNIEDELKQSYLDYAMSVIVGRALPDVRDGLKPVHRRVLFAMNELGNDWNKPYKKSARVVGDVIGKYHPHGDSAVYDTIVRMAQPFSMRYMLVDGQGNFGSVDGDSAAAMRYTEIRMQKISHDIMADLDKETVDYVPNYDGSEQIPAVMPTRIPNLLVNGSAGIAVGMATNIPPHNLTEVINGCLALIDDESLSVDDLMEYIPGPDFPTAAIINGRAGILQAYRSGRGRIYIRARADIEHDEKRNKSTIIVTELPYQLNKARLIEKIAELVKDKKIEGISELRDESDKDGMRVVIELRRGENADVVLNNLYAQTQLESVFGINIVALVDGQPKILNLKQMLEAFIRHRREVVTRRTVYELRKARERGHLVEGLAVALSNIDPMIELIKASPTSSEAQEKLMAQGWEPGYVNEMASRAGADACRPEDLPEQFGMREDGKYYLSPAQAKAILEMRLNRLTGLEIDKLLEEYRDLIERIAELLHILASPARLLEVIREELEKVKEEYGDERRTEITSSRRDLTVEDLIDEEDMVVTLSHGGYAKTTTLDTYQAQRRGGRGKSAASVKEEDYVEHMLVANTHTQILCFSSKGKVYWLKVYQIPEAGRTSRGRPIVNILPLEEGERITAMLPVEEYTEGHYVFMATAQGTVKKTPLEQFSRPRTSGLIALGLEEGDTLVGAQITDGEKQVMLLSNAGKAIRFEETDVRQVGRTARGVRGIKLHDDQRVISLIIPEDGAQILTASENGFGKRTCVEDFRITGRGGQGVISMQCTDRNGHIVGAIQVQDGEEVMLISDQGTLVRTRVDEISVMSRNTQGVTLIKVQEGEKLVGVARVEEPEEGGLLDDEVLDGEVPDGEDVNAEEVSVDTEETGTTGQDD